MGIDNKTKVVGLFTQNPTNLSAAMHNAAYEHLGLNFAYIPFHVENLEGAIEGVKALNFRGASVSMPLKQEVMRYILPSNVDPLAAYIGAVNTVVNDDGALKAYNTYWIGAVSALEEVCDLNGRKVFLVGSGGTAKAIAYGLTLTGCTVVVFNRTPSEAKKLATHFGISLGGSLEDVARAGDYDVLINATPVGTPPNEQESVVDEAIVKAGKVVMDVVAKPRETTLLRYAESKGCKVVYGYRMLLHQAAAQFELFTGQKAPFEVMERAVLEALSAPRS